MNAHLDNHLDFTVVDAPFEETMPVVVGVARALWGPIALHPGDRRRAREIEADQASRLADVRLALPTPGLAISGTPEGQTLVEDYLHAAICATLSDMIPKAFVLGLESWFVSQARQVQRMALYQQGKCIRTLGAEKGTNKRGWTWEETGTPSPWEDPQVLSASQIQERLTRDELWAIAKRFGTDIEATLADPNREAMAVEFMSLHDPALSNLVSLEHMDETRRAIDMGRGDAANYGPPDFDGHAAFLAGQDEIESDDFDD